MLTSWTFFFVMTGLTLVVTLYFCGDRSEDRDKPHTFKPAKVPKWLQKTVDYTARWTNTPR